MKLTKEQLRQQIRAVIKEQLALTDVLPGADGGFVKYAQKVDDLIEDFIVKAEKLHEEGVEMMKVDILGGKDSSAKVGERNRYINARVSFLKRLRGNLVGSAEQLRREV